MRSFSNFESNNIGTRYPFAEDANVPSFIPEDLFLDLLIHTDNYNIVYYLSKIIIDSSNISFFINDINFFTIDKNENYYTAVYDSEILKAKAIIRTMSLSNTPAGEYTFLENETRFEKTCIVPYPANVRHIIVNGISLTGNINIRNGYNSSATVDGDNVILNFTPGSGLGYTPCEDDGSSVGITKTNQIDNDNKNFIISGSECVQVVDYKDHSIVAINDVCEPCCKDCDQQLVDINNEITTNINSRISSLNARITALENP